MLKEAETFLVAHIFYGLGLLLTLSRSSFSGLLTNGEAKKPQTCIFIKKDTLAQVFACEFCEISKNTFFHRAPLVAAFKNIKIT